MLLCQAIGFSYPLTIGLSLFYALGSQAFCTSSQILWQPGPGVAFILGALLCLRRLQESGSKAAAALLSICCGMAIAIRPMDAVLVWPAGVIALALLVPLLVTLGVVAVIAIPPYQDYTTRAQVVEGLTLAAAPKAAATALIPLPRPRPAGFSRVTKSQGKPSLAANGE